MARYSKILVIAILVAFLVWCLWWWGAAAAQRAAWAAWFEDRLAAGWVAEHESLSVRGFPNRLDTTITDIELADPQSGWSWRAPFFQILMVAYTPNHIIAVWPNEQSVATPVETVAVTSDVMRGSAVFVPDTRLGLDRFRAEISALRLAGEGWETTLERANLATNRLEAEEAPEHSHAIGFEAANWILPVPLKAGLDPGNLLPEAFDSARIDLTAQFDAPWDRLAFEGPQPRIQALVIKDVTITWGDLRLEAEGRILADRRGLAEGTLDIKARNWKKILDLAARSGALPIDLVDTLDTGLSLYARFAGDEKTLNLPLSFSGGETYLGPIPLGPAPILAGP